ncbi:MAG: ribosome silencing factor [Christensenellales bacterium]|jgi:ribosome-associated protein
MENNMASAVSEKGLEYRIAEILDSKKAGDITIVSVGHLTVIAEKFVICSATSNLQVRSLRDEVEEQLKKQGVELIRNDGDRDSRWVVLDYGHVIVHIFHSQEREFYNIERLWADGSNIERYSAAQ